MRNAVNIGATYGRLTVLGDGGYRGATKYYACRCVCGADVSVRGWNLLHGKTQSCGCYHREVASRQQQTHGLHATAAYKSWRSMLARCADPRHPHYAEYGGAGITVDPAWTDVEAFVADMGQPPTGHTLDRIDNTKGYSRDNCRWASRQQQANNRRNNYTITHNGQTKTAAEWARELGMSPNALKDRIARGIPIDEALSRPKQENKTAVFDGRTLNLRQLSKAVGVPYTTIVSRYNAGKRGEELWASK